MWTKDALHEVIETRLRDYRLIVVANREPYIHRFVGERVECVHPASGMATALDPILRACGGVWVAHGGGSADRQTVDQDDHVRVPPDNPSYTLRRVWLTKAQEDGYYYGLSNEGLWPLCHAVFTRPVFKPHHWQHYREVNELFARAVLEEADGQPAFVFIQDYHFALLPRLLKQANSNLVLAHFWHIPWPNRELFRAFPWKEELLDGLLGNDVLGFHLRYHCQNFLDTADRMLEARVDVERSEISRGGKTTLVRPFPISIDFEEHVALASSSEADAEMCRWRLELGLRDQLVGIGIDRIDYTKGIPDRFRALDRLLEKYPQYRERLVFVQIGVPSRTHIWHYQRLDDELDSLVEEINWRWSTDTWRPIIFLKRHYEQLALAAIHRLAHFCVVNALHDGMNLVAKEYVASRSDEDGVLILSQFTGAARELTDALLVNPFSPEELTEAMHQALEMPEPQRRKRMQRMRAAVARNNIYRWAGKILSELLRFEVPDEVSACSEEVMA
jgi:alpha,alpha-trehalose-phosphate synthase [UDP-forming]